jgi:hypothetical protein
MFYCLCLQNEESDSDQSDSDKEIEAFWNLAMGGAKLVAAYVDLYLIKIHLGHQSLVVWAG